jgi:hypothetical protein
MTFSISGTIWKISCHIIFITYFTLNLFNNWVTLILQKRQIAKINLKKSCLCSNCKYFCFESGFKKISNNVDLYNVLTLESVCKIYPRRWHLKGISYVYIWANYSVSSYLNFIPIFWNVLIWLKYDVMHHLFQSLPIVVGPYTLSNLCQHLYAKNLGKIRLLKGNLI